MFFVLFSDENQGYSLGNLVEQTCEFGFASCKVQSTKARSAVDKKLKIAFLRVLAALEYGGSGDGS